MHATGREGGTAFGPDVHVDQVVYGLGDQGEVPQFRSEAASQIVSQTASRSELAGLCEQLKAWIVSDGKNLGVRPMVGCLMHGRSEKQIRVAPKVGSSDDYVAGVNGVVESKVASPLVERVSELGGGREIFESTAVGLQPDRRVTLLQNG